MKWMIITTGILLMVFTSYAQSNTLLLGEDQQSPPATLNDVAWVAGYWKGEAFGGQIEEIWSPPLGNSMMCVFKLVVDGQVDFYEICTIREHEGSLLLQLKHFHGNLHAWEEKEETIDWELVKVTPEKVYFDGFTFEKVSEKEMNVYVLFKRDDGSVYEMKFNYERERL